MHGYFFQISGFIVPPYTATHISQIGMYLVPTVLHLMLLYLPVNLQSPAVSDPLYRELSGVWVRCRIPSVGRLLSPGRPAPVTHTVTRVTLRIGDGSTCHSGPSPAPLRCPAGRGKTRRTHRVATGHWLNARNVIDGTRCRPMTSRSEGNII